ncbi:GNAT family N-acetyltransferase [Streptomyces sp. NPDC001407]|uniref:GNAT family N-acetyltransferase n=1 Tax=unclassified Streptomyces TaxID=2593676 RepID=UPI0033E11F9C
MEPLSLATPRLTLRPFAPSDADAVHAACQDPDIPRYTSVPSPYTREDARTFVEETCPAGWRDDSMYTWGLFTRDSALGLPRDENEPDGDQLVGSMCLVRLAQLRSPEHQAELGYWTAKELRGRGYTAEAAREVARWAFGELGVERLEWYAEAGNTGSRAVALKVGFRMEGIQRAKIPYAGTRRDAWTGSLLPSDLGLPSGAPYLPFPERT